MNERRVVQNGYFLGHCFVLFQLHYHIRGGVPPVLRPGDGQKGARGGTILVTTKNNIACDLASSQRMTARPVAQAENSAKRGLSMTSTQT